MIDMNKNMLVLAYLGDSIYEVYIRKYLVDKGISKVKELQAESIKYVSAKSQCTYVNNLIDSNLLTEQEIGIVKCARNHKNNHKPKNCDVATYNWATGFEALIGYLYLENKIDRIEEIINYVINERIDS